jgi:hypothetical protein
MLQSPDLQAAYAFAYKWRRRRKWWVAKVLVSYDGTAAIGARIKVNSTDHCVDAV